MTNWDYDFAIGTQGAVTPQEALKEKGRQGWEAVSMILGPKGEIMVLLKKPAR